MYRDTVKPKTLEGGPCILARLVKNLDLFFVCSPAMIIKRATSGEENFKLKVPIIVYLMAG